MDDSAIDSFDPASPPPLSPLPKNPDRFSSLPPELLDSIFDQAHSPDSPLTGPISSSLLPFWRKRHFKEVKITSYKQLFAFANNVGALTLGFVESLTIVIAPFLAGQRSTVNLILDYNILHEEKDPHYFKDSTVIDLFKRLSSIISLVIAGSSRLAQLVLRTSFASTCLPDLCELRLRSSFTGFADPFHPSHLECLKFYPDLNYLEYAVYRQASTILPNNKPIPLLKEPLGFFDYISLRGPLSASLTSARRLIFSLIPLDTLILEDSAPNSQLADLLRFVNSEEVELLTLSALLAGEPTAFTFPLLPSLLKFVKVMQLSMYGSLLPPTIESYRQLHKLPLALLQFERGSQLSTDGLMAIVSGPTKIQELQYLILNNVLGPMNRPFPHYSPEFTHEGLQCLIARGEVEGVVVEGEAIDAMEAFEAEYHQHVAGQRATTLVQNLMAMTRSLRIQAEEEEESQDQRRTGRVRGGGRATGQGRGRGRGQ